MSSVSPLARTFFRSSSIESGWAIKLERLYLNPLNSRLSGERDGRINDMVSNVIVTVIEEVHLDTKTPNCRKHMPSLSKTDAEQ